MDLATATAEDRKERAAQAAQRNGGIMPAGKKSIAICTPTLGMVSMWWTVSMVDLIWPMNCGRAFLPLQDPTTQGAVIGELRNKLVKMALDAAENTGVDLEYLFWIDDDVLFHRASLMALASHDEDIASGVYFSKTDYAEPLIFDGPSSGTAKFVPNAIMRKWGWANGLSLVRTSVYRRMMDELDLGTDKFGNPCFYKQPEFGMVNGQLSLGGTEDFHFFDNCSKLGYKPLIDCRLEAFGWHYDHAQKTGFPKPQWQQWLRREPVVWPQKEGGEIVWG